jgi:hypothetical protein
VFQNRGQYFGLYLDQKIDMAETRQNKAPEAKLKDYWKCPEFWAENPSFP